VNVAGTRRIPAATVALMTGLKVNTRVTTLDVERSRQRLIDSGLFKEPAYAFAGARWAGNEDFQVSDLDSRLGLMPGALLNMRLFDAWLQAVRDAYARQGYIVARTTHTFRFDDEARTAATAITIIRGPQARMGPLEIAGLPDEAAARLRESWSLAQGAIYNGLYVRDFLKAARESFPAVFREFPNVSVKVDSREGVGFVTVSLTFARQGGGS
jgi:outer membrane protein assembly factor BamA